MIQTHLLRTALIGMLAAATLTGCVAEVRPAYGPPPPYGYVDVAVVNVAPPPPQYEVIGVAPSPGYFWVGGVWFWEGGRHVWHRGHWQAPRAGYRWVPHHWDHEGGQWHLRGGVWERH
jgi:hypothetical protein